MKINKKTIRKMIIDAIGTILGSLIMAIGVALFLLPNQLSSGGIAGIATITYYLLKWPMGITILALNIPIFILSIYKIGKEYFIKSLIGTVTLSFFIDFLDKLTPLTNDRFLACVYGGVILGIGTAIVLKVNSSTGGSDMISNIVKKYNSNVRAGNVIVLIDIVIISLNVIFFKRIDIGLYSAITIYIMGKMIDFIFEGIDFTKMIFIISSKNKEIAQTIGKDIKRGVTGLYGKGMYEEEDKLILMCAAPRRDVSKIRQVARNIDSHCFIIISNAREVLGEGFKKE